MSTHHHFNYIELPSLDNAAMKAFYGQVFGWSFEDWGDSYVAIHGAGVDGGFDCDTQRKPSRNGALVILRSDNLESSQAAVQKSGGDISVPIFAFPGGRRFHFIDPSGNELAVWTPS